MRGSLTLSVDMSKAFDMVHRRRLRGSFELAAADPFLIDLVSVATKRGIKQGCKLAPSLFAFATFLLFRKLGEHCDIEALKQILTMYADDTLLQVHFDDQTQLQEALRLCDLLLDQLTELGFKVNPEKSALLLQLHGGSAQQTRNKLVVTKKGEKYVQLPSGRLIALKRRFRIWELSSPITIMRCSRSDTACRPAKPCEGSSTCDHGEAPPVYMAHHGLGVCPLWPACRRPHGTWPSSTRISHDISVALWSEELLPEHTRNQRTFVQAQGLQNSQSGTPPLFPPQGGKTCRAAAATFGS